MKVIARAMNRKVKERRGLDSSFSAQIFINVINLF